MRVISRSKNNFCDVIRLKIIESRHVPKETVMVGLEKSKQNGGQLKATTMTEFRCSNNGQAGRESGWRITCKKKSL